MTTPTESRWGDRAAPSPRAALLGTALVLLVAAPGAMWFGANALVLLVTQPVLAWVAVVLATATSVPYGVAILWFDRHEQEPWWLLVAAFAWGAIAATGVAIAINDVVTSAGTLATGDHDLAVRFTIVFAAPIAEELLKASALVVLFAWYRNQIDGVLDGVVYGTLVGLGFAWFENVLYYAAAGVDGPSAMLGLAWVRGVLSGVGSHATFTGLTGVGFGLARVVDTKWLRLAAPLGGLVTAIAAHSVWNIYSGQIVHAFGDGPAALLVGAPLAVALLQVPFISILLIVLGLAWRHEDTLIRRFLLTEADDIADRSDVRMLVPARRRLARGWTAFARGGPLGWWRHRALTQTLIKLAFERWHHQREGLPWAADQDEQVAALRRRVRDLRRLGVEV